MSAHSSNSFFMFCVYGFKQLGAKNSNVLVTQYVAIKGGDKGWHLNDLKGNLSEFRLTLGY